MIHSVYVHFDFLFHFMRRVDCSKASYMEFLELTKLSATLRSTDVRATGCTVRQCFYRSQVSDGPGLAALHATTVRCLPRCSVLA